MAEVYRATLVGAEGFARQVAIKRILPTLSADPMFAEMFVNEARLASMLAHPNIVSTLDFDRDAEQRLFLVMELVDGRDLKHLLATGRLPVAISAFIIAEVLRALAFAHDLEQDGRPLTIVHRDVSPHNVLLSWDGAVKLSDFGIAKAIAASSASRTGSLKGKVGYMSPEQAHGLPLDGRSDLFAVGVMFHELLTGARLFGGATEAEVLSRMLAQPISSPREAFADITPEIDFVCMRLLERDRDQRFSSAQAALEALLGCDVISVRGHLELRDLMRARFSDASPGRTGSATPPAGAAATAVGGRRARDRAALMDAETRTRQAGQGGAASHPDGTASATPTAAGERRPAPLSGAFPGDSVARAREADRTAGSSARWLAGGAAVLVAAAMGYFAFFTGGPATEATEATTGVVESVTATSQPAAAAETAPATSGDPGADRAPAEPAVDPAGAETPSTGQAPRAADDPGDDVSAPATPPPSHDGAEAARRADEDRRRKDRKKQARRKAAKEAAAKEAAAKEAAAKEAAAKEAAAKEAAAERRKREREANKEPGKLRITVRPWALVSIDGGAERQTPIPTVSLAPGRHRVRLRNDELDKTETRTVTIRSGKTQVINLDWR